MTPDLFTSTLAQLERENRALKARIAEQDLVIADFISITGDLWNVQARGVKHRAKQLVPHFKKQRAA